MKLFEEKQKPLNSVYNVPVNAFRTESSAASWFTCREQFASHFNTGTKGFFYKKKQGDNFEYMIKFIKETERRLKWKRSKFYHTKDPSIVYIELQSNRWINGPQIMRSLFTALVRAGFHYHDGNYRETLERISYTKDTKDAILRLLDGFTVFAKTVRNSSNWCNTLSKNKNMLKKLLRPNRDKIRELAKIEWEKRGKPEGQDLEIWLAAKEQLKNK